MSLCYKQNLIFQLRAAQPPYGKRRAHNCGTKFCYGQKNENNKAKRGFHTTSFTFYLLFLSILLWNLYVRCVIYIYQ